MLRSHLYQGVELKKDREIVLSKEFNKTRMLRSQSYQGVELKKDKEVQRFQL